jgi:hypothetical protein
VHVAHEITENGSISSPGLLTNIVSFQPPPDIPHCATLGGPDTALVPDAPS